MDAEIIPFPHSDRTPDSHERTPLDAERLGHSIDTHLDTWSQEARTHHPTLARGGFTRHILKQCTTPPEDTLKQAARQKRLLLQHVTLDSQLDTLAIEDTRFAEYFQRVSTWQQNPGTTEEYRIVTQCMYRLFALREQIAKQQGEADFGQIHFGIVLNRLVEELF